MTLVIDSSVAVKWVFQEEFSELAERFIDVDYDLVAPDFVYSEVSNVIWKKIRNGEIPSNEAELAFYAITKSLSSIIPTHLFFPRALNMSIILNHPVYDCIYLAVAELYSIDLITADRRFFNKVKNSRFGNVVYWIENYQKFPY